MNFKVAIQGVAGCFHDAAAREFFAGSEVTTLPCDTFRDLFAMLKHDDSLFAAMAIENTIAGSLLQNHELLRESGMTIVGEHKMHISHSLAAIPGQTIADITEVNSHPMALKQCEQFLLLHPAMKAVQTNDTAGSAKAIAEHRLLGHAAVCGSYAAKLYGLHVLADDIQTNKRNSTRFLIITNPALAKSFNHGTPHPDKASIAFSLPHTQGSLSAVLTIFSFYGMNLTKIQSMPIIGQEWEYRFYVDLTFSDYNRYRQSVAAVTPLINNLQILGEYEQFTGR